MSLKPKFQLQTNPFRSTPAISEDEILWAGFPDLKAKFEKRILRSIKIPNSTLVLNWGEYGSGKTHAARYFNKKSELTKIAESAAKPMAYSIIMPLPKGREPVYDIYVSILDQLNIDELRTKFEDATFDLQHVIESVTNNLQIQATLKALFNQDIDSSELKKYLYGNSTKTELNKLNEGLSNNILRSLRNDSDYISFIAGLFNCLTYKKEVYSTLIIWIDEFEDIAILSSSNIDKTNNFLREILDNTPNNLLIFLNLTQSALLGVSDLGDYISEAVKSRIKERINFEIPSRAEFKNYLKEILEKNRIDTFTGDPYFPFEETLIDEILTLLGNVSLRVFNEALSLLIELADMDDTNAPISKEYLDSVKEEIIGWKNE